MKKKRHGRGKRSTPTTISSQHGSERLVNSQDQLLQNIEIVIELRSQSLVPSPNIRRFSARTARIGTFISTVGVFTFLYITLLKVFGLRNLSTRSLYVAGMLLATLISATSYFSAKSAIAPNSGEAARIWVRKQGVLANVSFWCFWLFSLCFAILLSLDESRLTPLSLVIVIAGLLYLYYHSTVTAIVLYPSWFTSSRLCITGTVAFYTAWYYPFIAIPIQLVVMYQYYDSPEYPLAGIIIAVVCAFILTLKNMFSERSTRIFYPVQHSALESLDPQTLFEQVKPYLSKVEDEQEALKLLSELEREGRSGVKLALARHLAVHTPRPSKLYIVRLALLVAGAATLIATETASALYEKFAQDSLYDYAYRSFQYVIRQFGF